MPSIRVKNSNYAVLGDDPYPTTPRSLANIFGPSASSPTTAGPRTRPSLPALRPDILPLEAESLAIPRRPRSGTTASRIQSHVFQNGSIRDSNLLQAPATERPSSASMSPRSVHTNLSRHDGMLTMEGGQTDVRLASEGEPGLIESNLSLPHSQTQSWAFEPDDHHDDIVEHLDAIDPQIGAVTNLTNAANSILIPASTWYSRKPLVVLPTLPRNPHHGDAEGSYQVLEDTLDRHVDDVLRRPSKFKRTMQGVWSFLKTPMGIITGIYGFLVVFWGAAIVIFLIKIINFHNANTQGFWVEVSSQIENGLFTVTGIGFIPSRVLDTYRIWKIWHYKRKTVKLRREAGLPQLFDVDDLPDPLYDPNYVHVLTTEEQDDLHKQQRKFQYHQTWYRAHGTETHRAFPINIALAICFLNDGNSFFQILLCSTMWSLNRFQRPAWSTGSLIPASFLCGIGAAVLIWKGGEKTKRVEEVRKRLQEVLNEKPTVQQTPLSSAISNPPASPIDTISRNRGMSTSKKTNLPRIDSAITVDEHMTIPASDEKDSS